MDYGIIMSFLPFENFSHVITFRVNKTQRKQENLWFFGLDLFGFSFLFQNQEKNMKHSS